jgi:hypothetical protein
MVWTFVGSFFPFAFLGCPMDYDWVLTFSLQLEHFAHHLHLVERMPSHFQVANPCKMHNNIFKIHLANKLISTLNCWINIYLWMIVYDLKMILKELKEHERWTTWRCENLSWKWKIWMDLKHLKFLKTCFKNKLQKIDRFKWKCELAMLERLWIRPLLKIELLIFLNNLNQFEKNLVNMVLNINFNRNIYKLKILFLRCLK